MFLCISYDAGLRVLFRYISRCSVSACVFSDLQVCVAFWFFSVVASAGSIPEPGLLELIGP